MNITFHQSQDLTMPAVQAPSTPDHSSRAKRSVSDEQSVIEARETFKDRTNTDFLDGTLSRNGRALAKAMLKPEAVGAPGAQVSTFAVNGVQSPDIVLIRRVHATEEGPNFLMYVPDENGTSFHEFDTREEITAWLKEQANDPEKLDAFAAHFSNKAAPGQVDRVRKTMTEFAADDINAVVGSYGYERGDIFTRLHKDASVPPVEVNGLTRTRLLKLEPDGNATYIGIRADGQEVVYKYDAYGNLHGGSKEYLYFVKNGLNNSDPLVAMKPSEYSKKVASVSLDNVGANDRAGMFHEFLKQLRNPGEGLGTMLIQLAVPEDVAYSIEKIAQNPVKGTLLELNHDNRLGNLFGIDKQTLDAHLEQIGDEVQSRIPYYGTIRARLNTVADGLEAVGPPAPDTEVQVNVGPPPSGPVAQVSVG